MTAGAATASIVMDEKTHAIVNAARTTFLARGFDAASMDQIALVAGVSKRTVYNRFRSKEELFGAAIEETCKNLVPVNVDDIEASLPPEDFIRELSRQFLKGILAPDAVSLRRIAAFEAERTPAIGRAYLEHGPQWMVDHFAPILKRQARRGVFNIEDAEAALWQLGSLLMEPLYTRVLLGAAPDNLEVAIETQIDNGVTAFFRLYGAR